MVVFVLLAVSFVIIAIFLISGKKKTTDYEPYAKVSFDFEESPKRPAFVKQKDDGSFVLFGEKGTRVTLIGASEEIANTIKTICDKGYNYDATKELRNRLLEYDIQVAEVDTFQKRVRPILEERVRKLISEDEEWESLGEMDKKDKLSGYVEKSMFIFDEEVSPAMATALSFLASHLRGRIPLLKELVAAYGVENLNTYSQYQDRKHPVISIPNPNYRKPLENLVQAGLAHTGNDMSIEEVLSSLTLNQLNELAETDTRFTRKDKAIKYISKKDDVSLIVGKNIALRSLFILKPLPTEFQGFDFDAYQELLSYYGALADVVFSLYYGLSSMSYK